MKFMEDFVNDFVQEIRDKEDFLILADIYN